MKKRYLYITATILSTTLLLTGCGNSNESLHHTYANVMRNNSLPYEPDYGTYEWVSPDGVHYWVVIEKDRYGIAPRYNNKGNLVIDEIN